MKIVTDRTSESIKECISEQIKKPPVIINMGHAALLEALSNKASMGLDVAEIKRETMERRDSYYICSFLESDSVKLAEEAWRTHAAGYYDMGFIHESAIDDNGYLFSDIDKARGPYVQYYLAINPENVEDCGTMRKIGISENDDYTELPAYQICKDHISADGALLLSSITDQPARLKELAALSKTSKANQLAIFELLRKALHDGIKKKEVWMFSLVADTHDALVKTMGNDVFTVLGKDVNLMDGRVSEFVRLRPLLMDTETFLDTLYGSYVNEEDPKKQRRYLRSFAFFSQGLDESLMTSTVLDARDVLNR